MPALRQRRSSPGGGGLVEGFVTGVAVPISRGRTAATYEIVITDDEGRRTCTARLTCLLRDRPPA